MRGDVRERLALQRPVVAGPGGVEEHVQAAVPFPHRVDERGAEGGVAQVAGHDQRRPGQGGRSFLQPLGAAAGEHDLGAGRGQRAGSAGAET